MSNPTVYQFHAELLGYKPQIWRRFQVAGETSIAQLAYIQDYPHFFHDERRVSSLLLVLVKKHSHRK